MKLVKTVLALWLVLSLCLPAVAGPSCTVQYPRGFKVAKGTKKHPVQVCTNGDLEVTWGGCTLRYRA